MKHKLRLARILTRSAAALAATLAATLAIACGGNDNNDNSTTPPASPGPATTTQNPCPAASLASTTNASSTNAAKTNARVTVDPRGTLGDILWRHRASEGRLVPMAETIPRANADVGEIAVVQDEGDLIAAANTFDLQGTGLRLVPRAGGYDVSRTDGSFRAALGSAVTLGDDDSASATLAFAFSFYGAAQSMPFINSDGNITFGESEHASTARSVGRVLSGPPRIGPFFADLDPSAAGTVYVRSAPDGFTVTWCNVAVFDSTRRATFQTSLFPDGTLEMKYAAATTFTATDGIAATSPGKTMAFKPLDLSTTTAASFSGRRARSASGSHCGPISIWWRWRRSSIALTAISTIS